MVNMIRFRAEIYAPTGQGPEWGMKTSSCR
jgi:hypothetical protein